MAIPEGYVPLGLVGFTDREGYQSNETYMKNDLVHMNNSIWKCKADNTKGIVPAENESWEVFINSTTSLDGISAVDTKGIMGAGGEIVASQALIDALATKVMESINQSKIVNHFLATDPTTVLSGPMGKTLNDRCDQLNSDKANVNTLNKFTANQTIENGSMGSNTGGLNLLARIDHNPYSRASLNFNNYGIVSGTLFLDTDGALKFRLGDLIYTINMTIK